MAQGCERVNGRTKGETPGIARTSERDEGRKEVKVEWLIIVSTSLAMMLTFPNPLKPGPIGII